MFITGLFFLPGKDRIKGSERLNYCRLFEVSAEKFPAVGMRAKEVFRKMYDVSDPMQYKYKN